MFVAETLGVQVFLIASNKCNILYLSYDMTFGKLADQGPHTVPSHRNNSTLSHTLTGLSSGEIAPQSESSIPKKPRRRV